MIDQTWSWRQQHRVAGRREEAWLTATRLHALLDCYNALGGDTSRWRNEAGILRDR